MTLKPHRILRSKKRKLERGIGGEVNLLSKSEATKIARMIVADVVVSDAQKKTGQTCNSGWFSLGRR